MRDSVHLLWNSGRQIYRCELIKHLIKEGNFIILSSSVHGLPSNFFIKIVLENEFCCASSDFRCFVLDLVKFIFFILGAVIPYYIPIFKKWPDKC